MALSVSVVIPCRNEEKYIERCVRSILDNDYPADKIEVLVCDGQSDDTTPQILERLAAEESSVRYLINEARTTPFALNLGIEHARGEVIIILGGHAELKPDYLKHCSDILEQKPEVGCVGGIITNIHESVASEAIGQAMSSSFGVGNAHFRTGDRDGYVDTVAFGAYRKKVLDEIGWFDTELTRNQDDEINFRLIKSGHKIWLSRKIQSLYYVRASFKKLFRQYYQYGYWKVFVNKKHRTITTVRQLVPLFFLLFLIFGIPLAFLHAWLTLLFAVGLGAYLGLAALFAFRQSRNPARALQIVYSFFILHLSYGYGYLEGIIRFLILNKPPRKKSIKLSR